MQALEERDLQQKAEYDRIIAQMRQDNKQFIEQHRADNTKFIDIVERELQLQNKQLELQNKQLDLQNKQLRFLSWAIPVATGILALLVIIFGVIT